MPLAINNNSILVNNCQGRVGGIMTFLCAYYCYYNILNTYHNLNYLNLKTPLFRQYNRQHISGNLNSIEIRAFMQRRYIRYIRAV